MRLLAETFTRRGATHRLVRREGDIAIYEQTFDFTRLKTSEESVKKSYFEVFRVQRHDGYEIAGNKIEAAETVPSDEQWGMKGWTYPSLAGAEVKFAELKAKDEADHLAEVWT